MWCDCGSRDLVQAKGMNAVFNLKMEVTVGENLFTGVSVRTSKHCIHHIKALHKPHQSIA